MAVPGLRLKMAIVRREGTYVAKRGRATAHFGSIGLIAVCDASSGVVQRVTSISLPHRKPCHKSVLNYQNSFTIKLSF